ncbi:M15 family metallopeptidase [Pedobacter caeni]|uniref:D-alanyl-D-alanine dipeptidase n=1 Tax=Pedobacter caeni TaxID=288992 RepID=A0A1M5MHJ2_9SPHI|nr:M15 family metallopeptidase [Pedobacter caeni]SHG76203.1 D-alanyl-D-alanine dipeptidase [Pedobacter caeni]
MIKSLLLFLLCFGFVSLSAQHKKVPSAAIKVIRDYDVYLKSCEENPGNALLELKKEIPDLVLDIRYATTNNFMKLAVYKQARAFARKPVTNQLKRIQKELRKKGYGLKIYDSYRPYTATKTLYVKASDKNFVANPKQGSRHNRGCAVDLSLIYLKTGKDVPMPTPYDSFSAKAAAAYPDLPESIKKNRDLLIRVMETHGFKVLHNEWWHFDFKGWKNYDLMDIPFEKL